MTADSPAQTTREPVPGRSDRAALGLPAPTILSMCDGLLGEAGRRHHMFAWLRTPGAGAGEWLAVDAYYPRARLVVVCRSGRGPGPHDSLYREQIPAHGLGLLMLDPVALGSDRGTVEAALAAKFFDLEHVARKRSRPSAAGADRQPRPTSAGDRQPRPASPGDRQPRPARAAARTAPAPEWTPVKVEHTPVARGFVQGFGVLAGLAFAALLIAELYLGVIKVAFDDHRFLLGLAIVLELLSRALGTVACERAERRGWACACAIVGAPVVAWATLLRRPRIDVEPAPLAGLLALLAGAVAVLALMIGS
ncbi:MAG TPA: hypothetical protein VMA76_05715 [Solirubrobacteraceae bacterium]|nr:hypothetical protein [Solirubrobacteraceae bacterium]